MIKIIISVYIAAILLIAGFADAATLDRNAVSYKIGRVKSSPKVFLNVSQAQFDSQKEILTLSGKVSSQCLTSLNPEITFDEKRSEALVSISAKGTECLTTAESNYEVVIDLKSVFAEQALNKDSMVKFFIDSYVGAESDSFNYLAKQQMPYSFDTLAAGKIEIDHRAQKNYLVGRGSKIEIFSRFNLQNYENQFVQVKGLIPNTVSVGIEASPTAQQLVVGQLTTLR